MSGRYTEWRWLLLPVLAGSLACPAWGWSGPLDFAHGLYRQKRFELAAEEFAAELKKLPEGELADEARFFLAETYVQLRRDGDARPLYETLIRQSETRLGSIPADRLSMSHYRLGEIQLHARDYAGAAKTLQLLLDKFPDDALRSRAWSMLAESRVETNQLDEAIRAIAAGRAADPDESTIRSLTLLDARVAERQGRLDQARDAYMTLARAGDDPLADDATLAVGILEFKRNRLGDSLAIFDDFLKRFVSTPLRPTARLYRAAVLQSLGKPGDAELAYRELIDARESEQADSTLVRDAFIGQAALQIARKNFAEASETLARARTTLKELPPNGSQLFYEGLVESGLGRKPEAIARWKQAVDQFPTDAVVPQALYYLGRSAIEDKDANNAEGYYRRIAKEHPQSTWRNELQLSLVEAMIAGLPALPDDARPLSERIAPLLANPDPATAARLLYYGAWTDFTEDRLDQAAQRIEELAGKEVDVSLKRDVAYLRGRLLEKRGELREALAQLMASLAIDSNSAQARSAMTSAYGHASTLGDASNVQSLLEIAGRRPDSADVLLAMGNQAYAAKAWNEARQAYDATLAQNASNGTKVSALAGRGWCQFEMNDKKSAAESFIQASQLAPENSELLAESLAMAAYSLADEGQVDRASRMFERVFQEMPNSKFAVDAGQRWAKILAAQGKLEEADAVYEQLAPRLADDPRAPRVLLDRAWLAISREKPDEAQSLFAQILATDSPLASEAGLKLAELLHQEGKYDEALEVVTRAEGAKPTEGTSAGLLFRRGLGERERGKIESAKAAFQSLVEKHPESSYTAAAYFWLGECAFEERQLDEAIKTYSTLSQRPDAGKYASLTQLRLAQSYFEKEDAAAANKVVDELLQSTDEGVKAEATYLRARLFQRDAKFDEARSWFQKVIGEQRTETAAKAQFMIGETYFFQENYPQAIKELLKVQILYSHPTWQSLALVEIGKCHERLGEIKEAASAYETVLREFATESASAEAKRLLDMLANARKP